MRIVREDQVEWSSQAGGSHRGSDLSFKDLATGKDGTLENYWFALTKGNGRFSSPRHRHNFDQFRIPLEGRSNIDPSTFLEPGQIGYFPEGTPYGPQQDDEERLSLVLQFGAASGSGFISRAGIRAAQAELRKVGKFVGGIFERTSGSGKKKQDGFEAVWEQATGRKLVYPPPRYETPIYINRDHFAWRRTDQAGVSAKTLGVFSERETRLEMMRLASGATWTSPALGAIGLNFVLSGSGTCCGMPYAQYSAVETTSGEVAEFQAQESTELIRVVLPMLSLGSHGASRAPAD